MDKNNRHTLIYISGKYSAPSWEKVEQNIQFAAEYAKKYLRLGYSVHCPHTNTAHFTGTVPYMHFIRNDLEILSRCDVIVMIPGWRDSRGAKIELMHALFIGKRIIEEVE